VTEAEWLELFKLHGATSDEGGTGSTEPSLPPRAPPRTFTGAIGYLVGLIICTVMIVAVLYGGYTVLAGMGDCHNNYDAQTGQAC
jgi:hypothetical protein